MYQAIPRETCLPELAAECATTAVQWGLAKCVAFDPFNDKDYVPIVLNNFLTLVAQGVLSGIHLFQSPWPFALEHIAIPSLSDQEAWQVEFTQIPNLLKVSNGSVDLLLLAFQDMPDHFRATLGFALLCPGNDTLAVCLPRWQGRMRSLWLNHFTHRLARAFNVPIDSKQVRDELMASLVTFKQAVLDTSFDVNHPGNYVMNDLGPALTAYPVLDSYPGIYQMVRLRSGWFDEADSSFLVSGMSHSLAGLKFFDSRDEISAFASGTRRGLCRLWGAAVSPLLPQRIRRLINTRYANIGPVTEHRGHVIGVGIRGSDRLLLNLQEVLESIIMVMPADIRKKLLIVFHGCALCDRYASSIVQRSVDSEIEQAKSVADSIRKYGVKSAICINVPRIEQLIHLSSAFMDISPIGTQQQNALFYLDIPMLVHSPTGMQPLPNSHHPWAVDGNLTYTSIYRGSPHSACIFTRKSHVRRLVPDSGLTSDNPGRCNYELDPEMIAALFEGFWRGLQLTSVSHRISNIIA